MYKFEDILRQAINRSANTSRESRLQVYQAAFVSMKKISKGRRTDLEQKLTNAIKKIEAELAETTKMDAAEPKSQPLDNAPLPDQASSQETTNSVQRVAPATAALDEYSDSSPVALATNRKIDATGATQKKRGLGIGKIFAAGLGLCVIALLGWFLLTNQTLDTESTNQKNTATQLHTGEKTKQEPPTRTLVEADFVSDINVLSNDVKTENIGAETFKDNILDGNFVIKKITTIFVGSSFDIDTSKTYLLSLEIEQPTDKENRPVVNAGFITFDGEGNLLTGQPGPHRYFLNSGRINPRKAISEGGSLSISGVITGEGKGALDQFLPGTKSGRIILVVRPTEDNVVILKKIKLVEL